MKDIRLLLLILAAAAGLANAQTDVSQKYMVNADFSNGGAEPLAAMAGKRITEGKGLPDHKQASIGQIQADG